jgi:hypothetical protein
MPMEGRPSVRKPDEKELSMSAEAKGRRNRAGAKATKAKEAREKCTLLLQRDTSIKLSTLAAIKGIDRSTLADEILGQALRHVVIALRGPTGEAGERRADQEAEAVAPAEQADAA